MRNINFPIRNSYIVCGSLATQHARWHKNITLQEVEPSLRVIFGCKCYVFATVPLGAHLSRDDIKLLVASPSLRVIFGANIRAQAFRCFEGPVAQRK